MSTFKVGDRVRVIDVNGDRFEAVQNAVGTVTYVGGEGPLGLVAVAQDGHGTCQMYARRYAPLTSAVSTTDADLIASLRAKAKAHSKAAKALRKAATKIEEATV